MGPGTGPNRRGRLGRGRGTVLSYYHPASLTLSATAGRQWFDPNPPSSLAEACCPRSTPESAGLGMVEQLPRRPTVLHCPVLSHTAQGPECQGVELRAFWTRHQLGSIMCHHQTWSPEQPQHEGPGTEPLLSRDHRSLGHQEAETQARAAEASHRGEWKGRLQEARAGWSKQTAFPSCHLMTDFKNFGKSRTGTSQLFL